MDYPEDAGGRVSVILAIDAGTTSIRGLLYDDEGRAELIAQVEIAPSFLPGAVVEQDPVVWKEALCKILAMTGGRLSKTGARIRAIGLTAFRSPVFPMDRNGEPLLPAILWQDRRSDLICAKLAPHQDEVYKRSGMPITSMFSAAKIAWFKQHTPEIYAKTWKFSGIYEYLLWILCGNFLTDYSVASRSNLFNLRGKHWDLRLLEIFGIEREKLADLIPPGTICGKIRLDLAEENRLPKNLPIIAAGGDQQCALLGLTGWKGKIINTGTGAFVLAPFERAIADPERRVRTNVAALADSYIVETGIPAAGSTYRWFNTEFFPTVGGEAFATINQEIESAPPGAGGILFIPGFGDNSPGRGAFLNLDLDRTRGEMARSLLEGIAFELRDCLETLETFTGGEGDIVLSGGLSKFSCYNQILADILDREVIASANAEASARGAWLNTLRGIGDGELQDIYQQFIIDNKEKRNFQPRSQFRETYRQLGAERKQIAELLKRRDL